MNQAWAMPARRSFHPMGSSGTDTGKHGLEQEDCIDPPSRTLRRPRGRPPFHSAPTTGHDPQDESPPRRTWRRRNAHCSPSELRELREHHLHRNRVAASKYRQKHKTWSDTLAERCHVETEKRRHLQDLTRSLKEELLSLKEQAIHQSGCDCMIMKLYLERQTVHLLGLPSGSPMSITPQDSISPTSSSFTSSFDDGIFPEFV